MDEIEQLYGTLGVYETTDKRKFHTKLAAESCMGAIGRVDWVEVTTNQQLSRGMRFFIVGEIRPAQLQP